jgi:enolase
MAIIKHIIAREILDSRGNPTIETKVELDNGAVAKASVPSGASTGSYEALELRDGNKDRYDGNGCITAVENVNKIIAKEICGMDVEKQVEIDKRMIMLDGTENKSNLGANSILSVSLACARAASIFKNTDLFRYLAATYGYSDDFNLPNPCFNIFNGGKHADTNLDFQEFMVIPNNNSKCFRRDGNRQDFSEMVRAGSEIFHELGRILKKAGFDTDVGNEGGYAPDIISSIQAIELIMASIINAGYEPGKDIDLGIDVGSSGLYDKTSGKYIFKLDRSHFSGPDLIGLFNEWLRKFPIIYLEDGLNEDDWQGWKKLTHELGSELMVVGDDLFVTNTNRLRTGLKEKAGNAIIIKPNQRGTLTETIECVKLAQKFNYKIIVSHRSGETCDDFIADLAVAIHSDFIKAGSLSRGERLAKYNRLMEIETLLTNIYGKETN